MAHCENCSCPKKHSSKTPLPKFVSADEVQSMALFMAQQVHDTVMQIMNDGKKYGGIYKGKLSLHFEYDPMYLRDQLITTWEPRD